MRRLSWSTHRTPLLVLAFFGVTVFTLVKMQVFEFRNLAHDHAQIVFGTSAVASGVTQWTNPLSLRKIKLPEGFSRVASNTNTRLIAGAFTTNPDNLLEQLVLETAPKKTEFMFFAKNLYSSKAKKLDSKYRLSPVTYRKVGGVDVVEFGFVNVAEGVRFNNLVRGWTLDGTNFWHLITTMREDQPEVQRDSERFLEFLVGNSR